MDIAAFEIAKANRIPLGKIDNLESIKTHFQFSRDIVAKEHLEKILYGELYPDCLTYISQDISGISREIIDADLSGREDCKLLLVKNPISCNFKNIKNVVTLYNPNKSAKSKKCLGLFYSIYSNEDYVKDMLATEM